MKRKFDNVFTRIPEKELREIILNSKSIADVFRTLGLCISGDQYAIFKRTIQTLNIDLSHFNGDYSDNNKNFRIEIPIERMFKTGTHHASITLSKKIRKNNLLKYECDQCKNDGNWNGNNLSLQLDHINGINNDNKIENLRFLCPNCHSQTATYAGRKRKTYYFCKCGDFKSKHSLKCIKCSNKENQKKLFGLRSSKNDPKPFNKYLNKINWPPTDELQKLIWTKPLTELSVDLGCSDNAIKKHCEKNNLKLPPQGYWIRKHHGYSHEQSFIAQTKIRKKKRIVTDDLIQTIKQMLSEGHYILEIAKQIGFHRKTVERIIKTRIKNSTN